MLSQRDNEYKMPYCYFEKDYQSAIFNYIFHTLIKINATSFTTYNQTIIEHVKSNISLFLFKKTIFKYFAVTKPLKEHFIKYPVLQDGDGDVVFT